MNGAAASVTAFSVPEGRHAAEPVEASGARRDDVRLLAASPGRNEHVRFRDIGDFLSPGDLLVVNASATLPSAVDGILPDGAGVTVHFSSPGRDGGWIVELRDVDGARRSAEPVTVVHLPGDARIAVGGGGPRLWEAAFEGRADVERYLVRYGRPITYDYVRDRYPLDAYQTVFAREPGSAEMPSAARPFTHRLVTDLVSRGIRLAPVTLHCGVSSPEVGELPQPERFDVPGPTARLVNETKRAVGRVVAVGTTVTRALESAARPDGTVEPARGWTDLVLDRTRPARVVDALVTGWHPPGASHLELLEAVAGAGLVQQAYEAALARGYLWHEFGDSCLLLPERVTTRTLPREAKLRAL